MFNKFLQTSVSLIYSAVVLCVCCLLWSNGCYASEESEVSELTRIEGLRDRAKVVYSNTLALWKEEIGKCRVTSKFPRHQGRPKAEMVDFAAVQLISVFGPDMRILDELKREILGQYWFEVYDTWKKCEDVRQNPDGPKVRFRTADYIDKEFDIANSNGHLIGSVDTSRAFNEGEFFEQKADIGERKIIVFGCGHGEFMCSNHSKRVNPTHVTVDAIPSLDPDFISNFYDHRLWAILPTNHFEEVILEGAGDVRDCLLMQAVYSILKPGGVLKTLHHDQALWASTDGYSIDAYLYGSTLGWTGEPLLTIITYKEHLEKLGFTDVEIYTPSSVEDFVAAARTPQIRAKKPNA